MDPSAGGGARAASLPMATATGEGEYRFLCRYPRAQPLALSNAIEGHFQNNKFPPLAEYQTVPTWPTSTAHFLSNSSLFLKPDSTRTVEVLQDYQ